MHAGEYALNVSMLSKYEMTVAEVAQTSCEVKIFSQGPEIFSFSNLANWQSSVQPPG